MNNLKRGPRTAAVSCLAVPLAGSACRASTATDKLALSEGPPVGGTCNVFIPASVSAHKGHNVEITVTNAGDKKHGVTVDGYNISQTVDAGKTIVIRFTAVKTGTFRVWCQLHPTHKDARLAVA